MSEATFESVRTHPVDAITEKRIGRLVGRMHTDFLPAQTSDAIIAQAEKVRDVTLALKRIAFNSPERLCTVLGILSDMADVGAIRSMDDVLEETQRIERRLPRDVMGPPRLVAEGAPRAAGNQRVPFMELATRSVLNLPTRTTDKERQAASLVRAGAGGTMQPGMSAELPWKQRQWIARQDQPACPPQHALRSDALVCLHCGDSFTMLKRHIENRHRQTPEAYRAYWGLAAQYPMACEAYSELKKAEAEVSRFGSYDRRKKRQQKDATAQGE